MEVFSYLVIYIALILGMAVAQIIHGLATIVRARDRVKWYWLHTAWGIGILFYTAVYWWVLIAWRHAETFGLFVYLFLLVGPCLFNILATLFFPQVADQAVVDLRKYYYDTRKWVFPILATIVLIELVDIMLHGVFATFGFLESLPFILTTVGLAVLIFSCALTRNQVHHAIVFIVAVALAFLLMLGSGLGAW